MNLKDYTTYFNNQAYDLTVCVLVKTLKKLSEELNYDYKWLT